MALVASECLRVALTAAEWRWLPLSAAEWCRVPLSAADCPWFGLSSGVKVVTVCSVDKAAHEATVAVASSEQLAHDKCPEFGSGGGGGHFGGDGYWRPTVGDTVDVTNAHRTRSGQRGTIIQDDGDFDSQPYKVEFSDGGTSWFFSDEVRAVASSASASPSPSSSPSSTSPAAPPAVNDIKVAPLAEMLANAGSVVVGLGIGFVALVVVFGGVLIFLRKR